MPWEPSPEEADKFANVYIDESSQTQHRYLLIGGLVVPHSHVKKFSEEIVAARANTIVPAAQPDGTPRVMKWEKVKAYNFEAYKSVVETAFHFRRIHKLPLHKDVAVHCVCVDTSVKSLRNTGDGHVGVGFDKEFYFLCTVILAHRYKESLFRLFPDRRDATRPLREARQIMNYGAYKYGDRRKWPFRTLQFEDPETCQALQVVDIIIGGIAYKLNGHYDQPGASPAKRQFCDYLYELFKIRDIFYQFQMYRNDFFTLTLRPRPSYRRRELPPRRS